MFERLKSILDDPPPAMAFEISGAGVAAARIGARIELEFRPLKPGVLSVSPLKENVNDPDEFMAAVRAFASAQSLRKRRDIALILPDCAARIAVLDFDRFPADPGEQLSLVRFRMKRSVPFDVESAAVSYVAQPPGDQGNVDVVVVVAPVEIVARYEAPFRNVGWNPGLVTVSCLAALELAPDHDLDIMAKLSGCSLSVLVRRRGVLKLVRCLELPSNELDEIAAVLAPTLTYMEDNLGGRPEKLMLCGFGERFDEARSRFQNEMGIDADFLRSPLGPPGESNAGLLGYLRSIAGNSGK